MLFLTRGAHRSDRPSIKSVVVIVHIAVSITEVEFPRVVRRFE